MAGRLLAASVGPIDVALVSTAVRAQATFELAALEVGQRRDESGLYLAPPLVMLDYVRECDADTVLVVAHNPGTEELAQGLGGVAQEKFPTAAYAVLRAELPFAEWELGCADLVEFTVGRG